MVYTGVERRRQDGFSQSDACRKDRRVAGAKAQQHAVATEIDPREPRFATPLNRAFIPPLVAAVIIVVGFFGCYQHRHWSECRQTQSFAACWDAFH